MVKQPLQLIGYELANALLVSCMDSKSEWIMDSSCSFYMTPNKGWFEELKLQDGGMVLLGDKTCKVARIGFVRIKMHDGIETLLNDVRYVLELKRNLVSLGIVNQLVYVFKAKNGVLKVTKGSLMIMKGI